MLAYHSTEARSNAKAADKIKAKLKAVMGNAEEGILPEGVKIKAKQTSRKGYEVKPSTYTTIDVFVPGGAAAPEQKQPDNILAGG